MYIILSWQYSMFDNSYTSIWIVSSVYLAGIVPAIVTFIACVILVAIALHYLYFFSHEQNSSVGANGDNQRDGFSRFNICFYFHSIFNPSAKRKNDVEKQSSENRKVENIDPLF
jgi:hypothetical protein